MFARLTPVVKNIIIITAAVYIIQMMFPNSEYYLNLWNIKTPYFQPYQLFTYMFAHGGLMHILFNMIALAFIGPILESYWGPKKFLAFYLITGIGAALFNIGIDLMLGGGAGRMLGASGAIYGVLMGFGVTFPNMEVMLLIPPMPIKAKYLVFVIGGLTLLMDRSGQVAHFAHLGGALVGYLIIVFWRVTGR
jgi:membrane associated rhomboid family serine protease